jgi:large repetitive protein
VWIESGPPADSPSQDLMSRPSRIIKRLLLPALLALALIAVQVVLAAPPQPSFTIVGPNFTTTCGLYTFTSTTTDPDAGEPLTIDWDIAGTAASGSSVTETFATPGPRTINMTATDTDAGDGTVDAIPATPQTVTVGNGGIPNAAFSPSPNPAQPGETVTFNAAASTAQGGGSIAKYEWDLDGVAGYELDTGAVASATTSYAATGVHNVSLKVTDNCGGQDTTPGSVFVNNNSPTASFTVTPNPAAIGATVTFNGTASSDPGGSIAKYEWDLDGDGTFETDTGALATTTKAYTVGKTYFVKLRVTDNNGASSIAFDNLRVNAKPVPNFSYLPVDPLVGQQVTFDGTASADPDGTVASYQWDLDGNGSFEATGPNPTHTYNNAGTVSVKLRVTDSDNTQSDVLARNVTIQATKPNAGFTYAPHDPLPGQAVTLTSVSSPSASAGAPALEATQWDFAYSPLVDFTLDGAGGSIVTSFASAGPHAVAVKVTDAGGGYAIATDTIVVNAPPQASFTVSPSKAVEGKSVTLASTSSDPDGALAKQEWDFNNDGKYDRAGAVVSTSSLKKGTRPIRLRVTDAKGAEAISTQVVTVKGPVLRNPQDVGTVLSYQRRSWGVLVVGLTVKTPAKTSVAVTCRGRGCRRGTFRKRTRKKSATLSFPKLTGSLRAGAKVNIVFAKSGRLTGWDVYTVGHGKTALREGCKIGRAKKQKRCP